MILLDQFGQKLQKKTLGDQIFDNIVKQVKNPDKQEGGETVNELWKKLSKEMLEGIQQARKKGFKGIIYIQIREMKLPQNLGQNGDRYTLVFRASRPTPEQATTLYSHRLGDTEPVFEYALPELSWVEGIMRNKNSGKFTEKYINDIQAWIEGRLK